MLQIKTIKHQDPERFDDRVNEALADGWTLVRRLAGPEDFVAELEREIEKVCQTCKYDKRRGSEEPCRNCIPGETLNKWEAAK